MIPKKTASPRPEGMGRIAGLTGKRRPAVFLFLAVTSACLFSALQPPSSKAGAQSSGLDPAATVYWYERGVKRHAWVALDEVAVFERRGTAGASEPQSQSRLSTAAGDSAEGSTFFRIVRLPEPLDPRDVRGGLSALRSRSGGEAISPVLYTSQARRPADRVIPLAEILVRYPGETPDSSVAELEKDLGLTRVRGFDFLPGCFLYRVADAFQALDSANALQESGKAAFAYPNFLRRRFVRELPDDPLFAEQWYLMNTGQGGAIPAEDINVVPVWDTFRGSGNQVVAIVDDGLDIGHEDLAPNVLPGQSWDYVDGDPDPTGGSHGTACAGVAAARGYNGLGITGACPWAGLVGHRLLGAETEVNEADALSRIMDLIDIYSSSWGPQDDGKRLEGPGPLTETALEDAVTNGRQGRGSIYVWAGGNGGDNDNSNYDGYTNSRFTIAVAASDAAGRRAGYSEKGANILVNAPSSGGAVAVTTTDRTGSPGYGAGDYTDGFGGTSVSAPLVSGVVALMLEANPNLGWRDVQHILIQTAYCNDPEDPDWAYNGAGYPVNHKYGFGRVDARAAVQRALKWESVPEQSATEGASSPELPIPDDDPAGVSDSIVVDEDFVVEFVEIFFSAPEHSYWGDLEIVLESPEGTRSVLAETHESDGSAWYDRWRFGSVRHFGESSLGAWTLQVRDLRATNTGVFQSWTLKLYGHPRNCSPEEVYVEPAGSCGGLCPCYASFQQGMDAVDDGEVLRIAEGVYLEQVSARYSKGIQVVSGCSADFAACESQSAVASLILMEGSLTLEGPLVIGFGIE